MRAVLRASFVSAIVLRLRRLDRARGAASTERPLEPPAAPCSSSRTSPSWWCSSSSRQGAALTESRMRAVAFGIRSITFAAVRSCRDGDEDSDTVGCGQSRRRARSSPARGREGVRLARAATRGGGRPAARPLRVFDGRGGATRPCHASARRPGTPAEGTSRLPEPRAGARIGGGLVHRPANTVRPGGCKGAPDCVLGSARIHRYGPLPASFPGALFARQEHHRTHRTAHWRAAA